MDDMNNTVAENNQWQPIVGATSIVILAIPGTVLYLIVVAVILRNPKTFARKTYYALLLSLAISEVSQIFAYLFYLVPCIFLQQYVFGEMFDIIHGAIIGITCYYTAMAHVALIAINRYIAVCHFSRYQLFFSEKRTRIYLFICWLLGGLSGLWQTMPDFEFRFYFDLYTYGYDPETSTGVYMTWFDRIIWLFVFFLLIFCYASILLKRPTKNAEGDTSVDKLEKKRREMAEKKLALQFGIIALAHIMYQVTVIFCLLVYDMFEFETPIIYLSVTLVFIVITSCNPYVYLVFNSDIRSHFMKLFGRSESSSTTVFFLSQSAQR